MKPLAGIALCFLLLACLQGREAVADTHGAVPEYTMKAAYLYNFAKLTDWPAQPVSDRFNLCIFGQDDFGTALETLRGKTINHLPLNVRRIANVTEAQHCQLLFLGDTDGANARHVLNALKGTPTLTVTDADHAERTGAMLVLVTEEHRLSFEIHHEVAKRAQLKLSSKLLRLATRVTQ